LFDVDNISCINRTRTHSTIYNKKYRNESGKEQPGKRHSTAPEMVCGNRKGRAMLFEESVMCLLFFNIKTNTLCVREKGKQTSHSTQYIYNAKVGVGDVVQRTHTTLLLMTPFPR
jgi:hypothetical protein